MGLTKAAKKLALSRVGVNYNTNLNFFKTGFEGINIKEIDFWNKLQTVVKENVNIQNLVGAKLIFRKLNGDERIYDIIMIVGWYLSNKKSWVVFYNTSDDKMELWNQFTYNNPFKTENKHIEINRIYDFGQSEDTGNLYFLTETFEKNPEIFGDINNPPEHIFQVILLNGNENDKQFLTLVSCINPNNYLPNEKLELEINKIVELTNIDETQNLEMDKALHRVDEIEDNKYLVAIWNKSSDVEFGACSIWPVKYEDSINETEIGYNISSSSNPYRGKKQKGTSVQAHSKFSLKASPHPDWVNPISTFNLKGFSIGETSDGFVWLAKQIDDFKTFLFLDGSENRFAAYQEYYKEFITIKSLPPGYVKFIPNPGSKSIIEGGFSSSTSRTVDYAYSSFDYENNQQYRGYNFTGSSLNEHGFSTSKLSNYVDNTYIGDVHYEEVYNPYLGVVMYDIENPNGSLIYHDVTKIEKVSSLFAWECETLFEAVIHVTDEQLAKEEDIFITISVEFKYNEYAEDSASSWFSSGSDDFAHLGSEYSGTHTKYFTIKCNLANPSSGFVELDNKDDRTVSYFGSFSEKAHQVFHKKRLSYDVQFKVINNTKSLLSLKINYVIPQKMTITRTLNKGRFKATNSTLSAGWEKLNVKFTLKKLYWRSAINYIKNIFKDDSGRSNAKVPTLLNLPINSDDKTFTSPNFLLEPIIKTENNIKIVSYKDDFLTLNEWTLSKPSEDSTQPSTWNKVYNYYNIIHSNLKSAQLLGHDEDFKIIIISNLGLLYLSKNKLQKIPYSSNNNFFNIYISDNQLLSTWNIFADKVRVFQIVDEPKELNLNFEYNYDNKPLTVNRIKAITNDIIINASDVNLFDYKESITIYSNLENNFFYDYNSIEKVQFLGTQGVPIFENIINYQKEVFNEFVYNYNYNVELEGINFNFTNDAERTINDKIFKDTWNNNVWKLSDGTTTEVVTAVINEEQSEVRIDTSVFPVDTNVSLLLNDKLIGSFKNKNSIKIYWRE